MMSKKSCGVCYEQMTEDAAVNLTCNHTFCRECLQGSLKPHITELRVDVQKIVCPEATCLAPIP